MNMPALQLFIGPGGRFGDVVAVIWLLVVVAIPFIFRRPKPYLGGIGRVEVASNTELRRRQTNALLARLIALLTLLVGVLVAYLLRKRT